MQKLSRCLAVGVALLGFGLSSQSGYAAPDPDGTVHVKAFDLPLSSFLSPESQAVLKRQNAERAEYRKHCKSGMGADLATVVAFRKCLDERSLGPLVARYRARYPVVIQPQKIGGVSTEIIVPADGVSAANQKRVLINLHGGGFTIGAGLGGQAESIPIAAVGKFKVVSVDYRQAPEYRFPAASEDVAAVYRELLKTYEAKNIGIYGCSAGGLLTSESVAWFQRAGLPMPGAVGIFCAGASFWGAGDTGPLVASILDIPPAWFTDPHLSSYFSDTALNDSLAFPIRSETALARFPPSLLISSTRDQALSSVARLHSRLVAHGIETDLHVWEGLDHGFFMEPDLPESREVYDIAAKFFDRHLGQEPAPHAAEKTLEEILRPSVERFVESDKVSPPAPCGFLFVGSSSFVKWDTLATDMAPLPAINRGFGGSHIEYVNQWFDQVVAPYKPRAIVFYAGENDIGAGKSVERVVADFDAFMAKKTAALGKTPVYFISLKPSKLRLWQLPQQTQVNNAIRARAKRRGDLHYIDVATPMLQDGKPKDLYVGDNLHMNAQGYAIWTQAVRSTLLPQADAQARTCQRAQAR